MISHEDMVLQRYNTTWSTSITTKGS